MNFQLEHAVEILSQTPATVKSLLGNLSDDWTENSPKSESWSAFDIVGHLIHGEETDWITRAEIILAQAENRTFEPFDRFAQFEISKGKTLDELIETFSVLRMRNLETLREMNLTGDKLKLKAMHPELGEVTLEQLIATWTVHDLNHLKQLVTVLANKYAENVGAWKQYLSILQ